MVTAGMYGVPNWVDLATPDVADALRFYTELFAWDVERSDSPMGTYYLASVSEQPVGGMMAAPEDMAGMPATWSVFFHVADTKEAVSTVERARGSVLQAPFAIPDGTRVAIVADTTGAMFALSDGLVGDGAWYSEEPGAVSWVELSTRDVDAAEAFYAAVFGWNAATDQTSSGMPYTLFALGGDHVAGMMAMPETIPADVPSSWAVYFASNDCAATEQRATELGGSVVVSTTAIDIGRFAVLADPQGGVFQVMEGRG